MKQILILGGSGFIGTHCAALLSRAGYTIIILTRKVAINETQKKDNILYAGWDGVTSTGWQHFADKCHGIINLAGESIAGGPWNAKRKTKILESRVRAGKAVVDAIKNTGKISVPVIQASAIGFYGSRGELAMDETSPMGTGFLAKVSRAWEESTDELETMGVRRIILRFGVVLGADGGMLKKLVLPFKFFLGGIPGSGEQWISWVHVRDGVRAVKFLMENESASGIYNICSPTPSKACEFYRSFGKVLGRPVWVPMPSFLLSMVLGEMADEMILSSQRVYPGRLESLGFNFDYPEVDSVFKKLK